MVALWLKITRLESAWCMFEGTSSIVMVFFGVIFHCLIFGLRCWVAVSEFGRLPFSAPHHSRSGLNDVWEVSWKL